MVASSMVAPSRTAARICFAWASFIDCPCSTMRWQVLCAAALWATDVRCTWGGQFLRSTAFGNPENCTTILLRRPDVRVNNFLVSQTYSPSIFAINNLGKIFCLTHPRQVGKPHAPGVFVPVWQRGAVFYVPKKRLPPLQPVLLGLVAVWRKLAWLACLHPSRTQRLLSRSIPCARLHQIGQNLTV